MASVSDLDKVVAHPIKDFTRIAYHELHAHFRIVCLVAALRMLTKQSNGIADARHHAARAIG